ncbi:MAG: hypothetical protein KAS32_07395 [Candidatus Peribacteraceae bacterium]|nr:hypothetical protein [Candidatus Peribacteraceae bacterium]
MNETKPDISNMVIDPVPVSIIRSFIEDNHYSKSINGCKISQCYALYESCEIIGAILFGELSTTAWKKYGDDEKDVVELRRLVTLDKCPRNTESMFISRAIKHLKKHSPYKICISYADPFHGHVGYVYQASNWSFLGKTPKDKLLVTPEGRYYHSRALRTKYKGDYKPFVKRLRKMNEDGLLKEVVTPGKYIYSYNLQGKQVASGLPYPKL